MKTYLLIVFLAIQSTVLAQVTGRVLLSGTSGEDNSEVKVTFYPQSPTAQLDSAFTDISGIYSANIKAGIYTVIFSKFGYHDSFYWNGDKVPLQEKQNLGQLFLNRGATVYLSGKLEGRLTNKDYSTYYIVNGDIEVEPGKELIIEPCNIYFYGKHTFLVQGKLTAIGSAQDRIDFVDISGDGSQHGDWGGIVFKGEGSSASVLSYCDLSGGGAQTTYLSTQATIACLESSPDIKNLRIHNSSGSAIYLRNSNSIIEHNEIISSWGPTIWVDTGSTPTIRCNKIYDRYDDTTLKGIKIESNTSPFISGNQIHRMDSDDTTSLSFKDTSSIGIEISNSATPIITDNIIFNCSVGIVSGTAVSHQPDPTIRSNTLYDNRIGILLKNTGSATITMNLIAENGLGIKQVNVDATPKDISYNLVWGDRHFVGIGITGIGEITGKNSNGHNVDHYSNIIEDPLFEGYWDSRSRPSLLPGSPVINGGDPAFKDEDGSTKDIGASANTCDVVISSVFQPEISTLSLIERIVFDKSANTIAVEYRPLSDATLKIYSLDGMLVYNFPLHSSVTTKILNVENLPTGVYFCVLNAFGKADYMKFTIAR